MIIVPGYGVGFLGQRSTSALEGGRQHTGQDIQQPTGYDTHWRIPEDFEC